MSESTCNITNYFPAAEVKAPEFSSFVSFDIETTGLARDSHIIEIGAVKVINGEICDCFSELVDPGILIPYYITQITGINDEMVRDADRICDVLQRFCEFAQDHILVGHNAISFDSRIMRHWANEHGIYIGNDVFDTLRFLRYRCDPLPGMTSKKLSVLCDYFGIVSDTYHRAAADAEVTAKLYLKLRQLDRYKK